MIEIEASRLVSDLFLPIAVLFHSHHDLLLILFIVYYSLPHFIPESSETVFLKSGSQPGSFGLHPDFFYNIFGLDPVLVHFNPVFEVAVAPDGL